MAAEKPSKLIVVLGHADSGKSTLIGHLMDVCGAVSKERKKMIEVEGADHGRTFYRMHLWLVFLLDTRPYERLRGITIDAHVVEFETPASRVTFIDAPGRLEYRKNMSSCVAQADVAMLVVGGSAGAFEAGMSSVKELAWMSWASGIRSIIVVVTGLDGLRVSAQRRFDEIRDEVGRCLLNAGYGAEHTRYVPADGVAGHNLKVNTALFIWWKGETVLQAIDAVEPRRSEEEFGTPWSLATHAAVGTRSFRGAVRALLLLRVRGDGAEAKTPAEELALAGCWSTLPWEICEIVLCHLHGLMQALIHRPLRFYVLDVLDKPRGKPPGINIVVFTGRIATGRVRVGQRVCLMPNGCACTVVSIHVHGRSVAEAQAGQIVGLALDGCDGSRLRRGMVISDPSNDPARVCTAFTALITVVANHVGYYGAQLRPGYCAVVDVQTAHVACRLVEVIAYLDTNGAPREGVQPGSLIALHTSALVRFVPRRPVCIETQQEYGRIGSITIRDHNCVLAIGMVKSVATA